MKSSKNERNNRQELFREMVLGVLVYSVVLGFFNDYTDILTTSSYSVTFAVAVVLQTLTYLTFGAKDMTSSWFRKREGSLVKFSHFMSVWLIMFLSKFVFLAVIDFLFGESVEISGFVGLIAIIVTMTISKELIDFVFQKLEDEA